MVKILIPAFSVHFHCHATTVVHQPLHDCHACPVKRVLVVSASQNASTAGCAGRGLWSMACWGPSCSISSSHRYHPVQKSLLTVSVPQIYYCQPFLHHLTDYPGKLNDHQAAPLRGRKAGLMEFFFILAPAWEKDNVQNSLSRPGTPERYLAIISYISLSRPISTKVSVGRLTACCHRYK